MMLSSITLFEPAFESLNGKMLFLRGAVGSFQPGASAGGILDFLSATDELFQALLSLLSLLCSSQTGASVKQTWSPTSGEPIMGWGEHEKKPKHPPISGS